MTLELFCLVWNHRNCFLVFNILSLSIFLLVYLHKCHGNFFLTDGGMFLNLECDDMGPKLADKMYNSV